MVKIMMLFFAVLLILLDTTISNDIIHVNRSCESYNVPNNTFQLVRFAGKWYEIAKYGNKEVCGYYYFSYTNTSRSVVIHYSGTTEKNTSIFIEQRNFSSIELNVTCEGITFPAKVLTTDYNNYGVIWSCSNLANDHTSIQRLLVLSKESSKKLENLNEVRHVLNVTTLSNDSIPLKEVDQSSKICHKNTYWNNSFYNSTPSHAVPGRSNSSMNLVARYILLLTIACISKNY